MEEAPLHIVQADPTSAAFRHLQKLCEEHEKQFDYEPLWYWCALMSLTQEQLEGARVRGLVAIPKERQDKLLLLHHEGGSLESDPGASAQILTREFVPGVCPSHLEALVQCWVLNCFDYSDEPHGYCTYFFSSFMSHSCAPNAFWHYTGDRHVLRARSDIAVGDEVCISYVSENWLMHSGPERRWDLFETKRFWCSCERCNGVADFSRGFLCPNCREGTVFAAAPGTSPARSKEPRRTDLVGRVCGKCKHKVTRAEAETLGRYEKALHTLLDAFVGGAEAATEIDGFIDCTFAQHWLADLACEQLLDFHRSSCKRTNNKQVLRLLKQRCDFHAKVYSGLSGAYAWAMEAYGDELKLGPGQANAAEAQRLHMDALEILRLMYGSGHEDISELERKCKDGEAAADAATAAAASVKRRRLVGKQSGGGQDCV